MKKHDKDLAAIVQAKADFLIALQFNCGLSIGHDLATFKSRERAIDAMPSRGGRQRELRAKLYRELDESMTRFQSRIGGAICSSFGFVDAHQGLLAPGVRKLFLRGGK